MSLATGSNSALRLKEETTYGTPATGNYESISFNSETLQGNINTILSQEIKSNRTLGSVRGGNINAAGDIVLDLYIAKLGLLFKHLTAATDAVTTITPAALAATSYTRGTYVTSNTKLYVCVFAGTVGSIGAGLTVTQNQQQVLGTATFQHVGAAALAMYQHLWKNGIALPTGGLTIEKLVGGGTANTYFPFVGCRVNQLALQIPQEGIVSATWSIMAQQALAASVSSIAGTPVIVADDPATGFEAQITLNSAVSGVVQSASLNVTNNLDGNAFVIGSRFRADVPTGRREITGTLQMFFQDMTNYNLFINETVVPINISMIHNGFLMNFDMPECKFTGGSPAPAIAGNGTVSATFNFQAFQQTGTYDLEVRMYNSTASY